MTELDNLALGRLQSSVRKHTSCCVGDRCPERYPERSAALHEYRALPKPSRRCVAPAITDTADEPSATSEMETLLYKPMHRTHPAGIPFSVMGKHTT